MGRQDAVFLRSLLFDGNHGYTDEEQRTKRRFRVNVELFLPLADAAKSDALEDTVDYFWVSQKVIEIGTQHTFRLIERLAGKIGEEIHGKYPHVEIVVTVDKLNPPCPGPPESCGVRLCIPAS